MTALVSCIIPVHNGERFLREAVDSVLAQSSGSSEIIVVDDGSTDGTAAVARSYGDALRYEFQANAGPPAARNVGLALASGELIAFLDADDRWHRDKLARQLAVFDEQPAVDCCLTHGRTFWEDEHCTEAVEYRRKGIAGEMLYIFSSILLRRRILDAVGVFDSALLHTAGIEWFARARARGMVEHVIAEALIDRRMHADNFSRRGRDEKQEELLRAFKRRLDRARESGQSA
ncbi:MAG: glycosyltransferase family 2 protein [Gemmatimonadota bacterium]|nr:glycosyltransferase family 2 protein [Gemmatimonadota bacterium]